MSEIIIIKKEGVTFSAIDWILKARHGLNNSDNSWHYHR